MHPHPLLSYELSELDHGMDETCNYGEPVLELWRKLLVSSKETPGMQEFLDPSSDRSMAKRLCGKDFRTNADADTLHGIIESVLEPESKHKPHATLLRPTKLVLGTEEADKLTAEGRLVCIAVKNTPKFVALNKAPRTPNEGYAVLTWEIPRSSGGKWRARLVAMRVGPGRVRFTIHPFVGKPVDCYAADVEHSVVDRRLLPDQLQAPPPKEAQARATTAVPCLGSLPFALQLQLAGFAQDRLRAHVLVAAAGPATTNRPMVFDKFCIGWVALKPDRPRVLRIRALLHPSSATCFCRAHMLRQPEHCGGDTRFTGRVTASMTIEMCGACIDPEMGCPVHSGGGEDSCRRARFAPGVCCTNLTVRFSCAHQTQGQGTPPAMGMKHQVSVRTQMPRVDWEELSMLVAAAAQYHRAAEPLHAKAASADPAEATHAQRALCERVDDTVAALDEHIAQFDLYALPERRHSDADLARLDAKALRLLRGGGVAVQTPPKTIKLVRPGGLALQSAERKLVETHAWLFPGPDTLAEQVVCLEPSQAEPLVVDDADGSEMSIDPMASAAHLAKRQRCVEQPGYDYVCMTEYLDPSGLANLRGQLAALLARSDLTKPQRERAVYFQGQLEHYDQWYGPEEDGPLGLPARPLEVTYRSRNDGGRLYPTGMAMAPGFSGDEERSLGIQGAPRELRTFMCGRWGRDFDMENAQLQILRQLGGRLTWVDERAPPQTPQLDDWCANRKAFIEHVADEHNLPSDDEMYSEYRKDTIKELVVRLTFGGSYEAWRDQVRKRLGSRFRNGVSSRVDALAQELHALRNAVFSSNEWCAFVERDRSRLRAEGKKQNDDEIDRSVFARIAQKIENDVLTAMRAYLRENRWTVLVLCFDGLIVQHRPERVLDLAAMCTRITEDTGYVINVVEKPLFCTQFPRLSLDRFRK